MLPLSRRIAVSANVVFSLYPTRNKVYLIRSVVPEAGIKDRGKQLHPTGTVGCNYLSLPLIVLSIFHEI